MSNSSTPRANGAGAAPANDAEPRKRRSGPSGQHRNHRKFVGLSPEAWDLVEQAMAVDRDPWPAWARTVLAEAVAARLKLDVIDTVALFERE